MTATNLSGVKLPYDRSDPALTFVRRIRWVATQLPDHIAILEDPPDDSRRKAGELTYADLDRSSDALAAAMRDFGVNNTEPVAILCDQSAEAILAMLATLKAGAFYLALDAHTSIPILLNLMDMAGAQALLTPSHLADHAHELAQSSTVPILEVHRQTLLQASSKDKENPACKTNVDDDTRNACLVLTSGSTGQPKGTLLSCARLTFAGWREWFYCDLRPDDRVALLFGLHAGGSLSDVFGALLNGATLYPFDARRAGVVELRSWLVRNKISVLHPPVTLFRDLAPSTGSGQAPSTAPVLDSATDAKTGAESGIFASVRLLILDGQTVRHEDVQRFRSSFPHRARMVNRLGLGEGGVVAQMFIDHETPLATETVPVGHAVAGFDILIYDDDRRLLVPTAGSGAVTGEIAIRGTFAIPGYWRQPNPEEGKFLPDPDGGDRRITLTGDMGRLHPDGLLEHLGRKDFMVKIRGYRVELEAVEAALRHAPGVKEVAVVAQGAGEDEKRLVAFVVPGTPTHPPTTSTLRQALVQTLPGYMIPSIFVSIDTLPLTSTGKIDRMALTTRPVSAARPELDTSYVPPVTTLEALIVNIWTIILDLDRIGIDDAFLDLGGNSMLAARILARLSKALTLDIPYSLLAENGTPAALAAALSETLVAVGLDAELAAALAGLEELTDAEAQAQLDASQQT